MNCLVPECHGSPWTAAPVLTKADTVRSTYILEQNTGQENTDCMMLLVDTGMRTSIVEKTGGQRQGGTVGTQTVG